MFFKQLLFIVRYWHLRRKFERLKLSPDSLDYSLGRLRLLSVKDFKDYLPKQGRQITVSVHTSDYQTLLTVLLTALESFEQGGTLSDSTFFEPSRTTSMVLDDYLVKEKNYPLNIEDVYKSLLNVLTKISEEFNKESTEGKKSVSGLKNYYRRKLTYITRDVRVLTEALLAIAYNTNVRRSK